MVRPAPLAEHQEILVSELRRYRGADPSEESHRLRILHFVEREPLWWHRETMPGHVTASAFVVDLELGKILLHHHRKLDRWLQLGGHDEGERSPARAVIREVEEESGLENFDFYGRPVIFDLDIHPIPTLGAMPAHDHLDVRYLMVADPADPIRRADSESRKLRWLDLDEAAQLVAESGFQRVVQKIRRLRRLVN